jgi:hypothetical protein
MKIDILRKGRILLGAVGLAGGLVYSTMALVVTPKPVYAFSCGCAEALQDAQEFCQQEYGDSDVATFQCFPNGYAFTFRCAANLGTQYSFPCSN